MAQHGARRRMVDVIQRVSAAACLYSAYQAACSDFDGRWVVATGVIAMIVATASCRWVVPDECPDAVPWSGWVVACRFLPGWILLALAAVVKALGGAPHPVIWTWCAGALWVLVGAWLASRAGVPPPVSVSRVRWSRATWICAVLLFVVAAGGRVWRIDTVPRQVHCDEGTVTFQSHAFYTDPTQDWFAPPPRAGSYSIMNFFYALAGAGEFVFGRNVTGARAVDVLLEIVSILLLFDGLRRVTTLPVAAVSAFLLAVNHCHLAYSRIASGYIQTAFVVTLLFTLASRVWTVPTYFNAVALGLVAAAGMQTYPASLVTVPLLVVTWGLLLWWHPARRRALAVPVGLAAATCIAAATPFGVALWQQAGELFGRSREVNIFSPPVMGNLKTFVYHTDSTWEVVAQQAWNALTGFHRGHDAQPQYGILHPMADRYAAALMIPGLVFTLFRCRDFLVVHALVFTTGQLLLALGMQYAPGFNRATGALPFGMAFAAIGLVQCCATLWAGRARLARWGCMMTLTAVVTLSALTNLRIYFVECWTTLLSGDADSESGWVAREFGAQYRIHLVDWFPPGPEGQRLITAGMPIEYNELRDSLAYAEQVAVVGADLFIVSGEDQAARDVLVSRFPAARVENRRHHPSAGPTLYLVFVETAAAPPLRQ